MTQQEIDNREYIRIQFEDLAWGEVDRQRITSDMAEMAIWLCVDWCEGDE